MALWGRFNLFPLLEYICRDFLGCFVSLYYWLFFSFYALYAHPLTPRIRPDQTRPVTKRPIGHYDFCTVYRWSSLKAYHTAHFISRTFLGRFGLFILPGSFSGLCVCVGYCKRPNFVTVGSSEELLPLSFLFTTNTRATSSDERCIKSQF